MSVFSSSLNIKHNILHQCSKNISYSQTFYTDPSELNLLLQNHQFVFKK